MIKYGAEYQLKQQRDELGRFIKMLESKPYEIIVQEAARAQEEVYMEVPVKTGRLKAGSIIYVDPSSGTTKPTVYGIAEAVNPDTGEEYAEDQHDNTQYNHPNGGKPFFIRDPMIRMADRIDYRIQEEINNAIRRVY